MTTNPFRKACQSLASRIDANQFARELVGAAFDTLSDKIQERAKRAPEATSPSESGLSKGARLSRFQCPECRGVFYFMRNDSGDDCGSILYWCPSPRCGHHDTRSPRETEAREGITIP